MIYPVGARLLDNLNRASEAENRERVALNVDRRHSTRVRAKAVRVEVCDAFTDRIRSVERASSHVDSMRPPESTFRILYGSNARARHLWRSVWHRAPDSGESG